MTLFVFLLCLKPIYQYNHLAKDSEIFFFHVESKRNIHVHYTFYPPFLEKERKRRRKINKIAKEIAFKRKGNFDVAYGWWFLLSLSRYIFAFHSRRNTVSFVCASGMRAL